jgi:large subunit ribosomal protein L17
MRHQKRVKTLNRTKSHRKALLMNLANALFHHERIKTTSPKAMELKKVADRLITLAKRKDGHAMRLAFAFLRDKGVIRKLFGDIGERYGEINGGYTRVLKVGRRKGDAAPMAVIELTQRSEKKEKPAVPEKKAPQQKKEAKAKEKKATKASGEKAKKEAVAKKEPKEKKAKAEPKEKKTGTEPKEKKPRKAAKKQETEPAD